MNYKFHKDRRYKIIEILHPTIRNFSFVLNSDHYYLFLEEGKEITVLMQFRYKENKGNEFIKYLTYTKGLNLYKDNTVLKKATRFYKAKKKI